MKRFVYVLVAASLIACPVQAGNKTVEDAIKSRDDLSLFYEALLKTGVLDELEEGKAYAVFAPTNEAFEKAYDNEKTPCFGHEDCEQDFADIMRNHFVPGFFDLSRQNGLFAVNDRQIIVGHPHRGHNSVDGNMVSSTSQLMGSVLYQIDGVIMNENEAKMFRREPRPIQAESDDTLDSSEDAFIESSDEMLVEPSDGAFDAMDGVSPAR